MASRYGGITGSKSISEDFQNINTAFENVQTEMDANKGIVENHIGSTSAHMAQNITYSGAVVGASNVKQALDNTKQTIDDLILGSGDSGPEVAAARGGHATLGDRLDASDVQLTEKAGKEDLVYNVKFPPAPLVGAVSDGTTDASPVVKAIRELIVSSGRGGTIHFPAGKFLISSKVLIEVSSAAWIGSGINLTGDSPSSTAIICNVPNDFAFEFSGVHGDALRISNISFVGKDILTNNGIWVKFSSESYFENILFNNCATAMQITDCVRNKFVSCTFNQNSRGLYGANQVVESTPNAIDLVGCCFYGNGEYAAYFIGGCNINLFGGTIEANGHFASIPSRWGLRVSNGGRYGGAVLNVYGTYFEGNQNVADIWLETIDYDATYLITGCTFNRFASPLVSKHCIELDTSEVKGKRSNLTVVGCNFEERGGTTTSETKYIEVYGKANVTFEQMGNQYMTRAGIPEIASNRIFASARFTGLSGDPVLNRGFNIASIIKNGTGDYTITFKVPSVSDPRIKTGSIDGVGFVQLTDLTGTTMRVRVYDVNGTTLKDPLEMSIIIME